MRVPDPPACTGKPALPRPGRRLGWRRALAMALVLFSGAVAAESFFERVGQFIGEAERTAKGVARVLGGPEETARSETPQKTLTLPTDLPQSWQIGFVHEPVFDSRILVAETGLEHSQTVVLVHGLGENGLRDWRAVIPALAEHYHVLAFDLPGFGHSENPGGRYSPTQYARLVHWLVERTGQQRVHLVGHSLGGAIALRYAARHPERVERLALVSVAGVLERTAFMKHTAELPIEPERTGIDPVRRAASRVKSWAERMVEVVSASFPDPTVILKHSNTAWNALLTDRPNINAALSLIEEDYSQAIAGMNRPTLVLWGSEDQVAPPRTGRLLAGRLSRAGLEVIDGAGHPVIRTHADRFNNELRRFLADPAPLEFSPIPAADTASRGDLHCQGQAGGHYSGHYRRIVIENCSGVQLVGVRARSLTIKGSRVFIGHMALQSPDTALRVSGSSVQVTHARLTGERGIEADDSTLDLAGVTIVASEQAVRAGQGSRFVFSVSDIRDPVFSGTVHGVFSLVEQALGHGSSPD